MAAEIEQKSEAQIEYENVTVKIPKLILDFLRSHEKEMNMTTEEYIMYGVVGLVRADLDAGDVFVLLPEQIAENWKVNPVFKDLLNDAFPDC